MLKKILAFSLCIVIILVSSCAKQDAASIHVESEIPAINDSETITTEAPDGEYIASNPVDNAFKRASEHLTAEQMNSDVYAYLLAWKWHEELDHFYRNYHEIGYSMHMTIFPYMEYVRDSVELKSLLTGRRLSIAEQFFEYADYYRNQTLFVREKYKEIGRELEFSTDGEKLYQMLIESSYKKNYTDTFRSFPALVGSIPDENIYLFGFYPFGMLLEIKGQEHLMDWTHPPENRRWPELMVCDFDGNGKEELLISMFYISGSPNNKQSLHVVSLVDDTLYEETELDYDRCAEIIIGHLSSEYLPQTETIRIMLDEQAMDFDAPEDYLKNAQDYDISYGHYNIFELEENQVSVLIHFGFSFHNGMPAIDIEILADVIYSDYGFNLENLRFAKENDTLIDS